MVLETLGQMLTDYLPAPFNSKYLIALIFFVAFFLLSKAFVYIVEVVVIALTKKTKTNIDDLIVERTNKPISWLLIFIGAKIAVEYLDLANGFGVAMDNIFASLLYLTTIYLIAVVVIVIIDYWGVKVAKKTKSSIDDALVPLFKKTVKVVFVILAVLYVLPIWNIDITSILAGVGIAGLAIGFAVKDTLANIFGGVSLIMDRSIKVGDRIEVDGVLGIVQDVGIRATRVKTFSNELVIIPNGVISTATLKNYHQPDHNARVDVEFGVEYGADPDKVKKIVLAEIKKIKNVLKEPEPSVRFMNMGASSLDMKAMFWVDAIEKAFDAKEEGNTRIYNVLNKAKIGIPFPQMDVHLKKK